MKNVGFVLFGLLLLGEYSSQNIRVNPCDAEGVNPNNGIVPHELSCRHFYKCSNGVPVLFLCPENLEFNPVTLRCDWPGDAGCSSKLIDVDNSPCEPLPKPVCPPHEPNKLAVHLPHPVDCRMFYQCDWEKPYLKECPVSLHFNAARQVCDQPERAKCACRFNS